MDVLLRARDLRLPPRLQGLNLTLRRGETLALLGINGAGKSTALATLAGVLPGMQGRLEVLGVPVDRDRTVRRHIGWLPQRPPLYAELTVEENLRFFAGLQRQRPLGRAEAAALLDRFELSPLRRRLVHRLSGGEQMRLGLACVLAHEPRVLLLDEPTAGLDPLQAERLRELIRGLAGGRAVLIATHLLPDVEGLCDRVLLMHEGRIIGKERLTGDHRRVRATFASPPPADRLLALPGVTAILDRQGGQLDLELAPDAPADLLETIAGKGWGLSAWHPQPTDLLARFRALSTGEPA